MGQRSGPAPFLTKTYELVGDESTNDVVSWGEKGDTFVVWKIAEFAKDLLPAYFKHNNFSSFVRQLNTYGFRKIVPDKWEFANENFKRGQKDLLAEIRRRKTTTPAKANGKSSASQGSSGEEAGSTSSSSHESSRNRSPSSLADLSGENAKLRRENEMLSSELARTQKQFDELAAFLSGHLKVDPLQILQHRPPDMVAPANTNSNLNDDGESEEEECRKVERDEGLRLFGVWFGNKRRRCHPYECDSHGDNHLPSNSNVALRRYN